MTNPYGPWATLIDAGGNPQLSAFWRRRLTMLVPASQTSPMLSRRNLLWLAMVAALMLFLPTFRSAPSIAGEEQPTKAEKSSTGSVSVPAKAADKKPAGPQKERNSADPPPWKLPPWKLPNGVTIYETISTKGDAHGPGFEKEIDKLIAAKKYTLVKTFGPPGNERQYVYCFVLSDGKLATMNFSMPLENVASSADYGRKQEEQRQQRHEKINQAIAAGRFRLINQDVIQVHLCRDVASKENFEVRRDRLADGKEIACPQGDHGKVPATVKETSWKEHLRAIREGKRELLSFRTTNIYTYEMIANDGTKLLFQYGGGEPLKKIEKK
jgi:hypothetical protein